MLRINTKLLFLIVPVFVAQSLFGQQGTHILGLGMGLIPKSEKNIWLENESLSLWVERETSPLLELSYYYRVCPYFQFGSFFELENLRFSVLSDDVEKATHWNFGFQWLGRYPDNEIFWQMGGYVSYGGFSMKEWGYKAKGINMGLITGPGYEKGKLGVAFHVHAGFGWYPITDDAEEFDLYDIKLLFKIYYKLN
jgi:hypothetical protein